MCVGRNVTLEKNWCNLGDVYGEKESRPWWVPGINGAGRCRQGSAGKGATEVFEGSGWKHSCDHSILTSVSATHPGPLDLSGNDPSLCQYHLKELIACVHPHVPFLWVSWTHCRRLSFPPGPDPSYNQPVSSTSHSFLCVCVSWWEISQTKTNNKINFHFCRVCNAPAMTVPVYLLAHAHLHKIVLKPGRHTLLDPACTWPQATVLSWFFPPPSSCSVSVSLAECSPPSHLRSVPRLRPPTSVRTPCELSSTLNMSTTQTRAISKFISSPISLLNAKLEHPSDSLTSSLGCLTVTSSWMHPKLSPPPIDFLSSHSLLKSLTLHPRVWAPGPSWNPGAHARLQGSEVYTRWREDHSTHW